MFFKPSHEDHFTCYEKSVIYDQISYVDITKEIEKIKKKINTFKQEEDLPSSGKESLC